MPMHRPVHTDANQLFAAQASCKPERTNGVRGQLCVCLVEALQVQVRVVAFCLCHRRYPLEQLQARLEAAHLPAMRTRPLVTGSKALDGHVQYTSDHHSSDSIKAGMDL